MRFALRDKVMPSFALTAQLLSRSIILCFEGIGWVMGVGVYDSNSGSDDALPRFRWARQRKYFIVWFSQRYDDRGMKEGSFKLRITRVCTQTSIAVYFI